MVGEFPELQGIMGGYYARAQGHGDAIADAILDHYKPIGQGDDVPTAPVTVAVSLADKLDTLIAFFAIDERPSGSKDPFALRRSAIGILSLLVTNKIRLPFSRLGEPHLALLAFQIASRGLAEIEMESMAQHIYDAWQEGREFGVRENGSVFITNVDGGSSLYGTTFTPPMKFVIELHNSILACGPNLLPFLTDRLKVQQREAGVRHDLIDAVFALGGEDDLVRLLARVKALQAFVGTDEGANLLAGYKRAANILKSSSSLLGEGDHPQGGGGVAGAAGALASAAPPSAVPAATSPSKLKEDLEDVERALVQALNHAEPFATAAIEAEDFEAAMAALATLRAPIDAFFEGVMVNDPDPAIRAFRIGLLQRVRDAVHRVADFSKIEG